MSLIVVDATPEHIDQFLSKPLRQDDSDEWFAANGGRPVRESLKAISGMPEIMETCRALLNDSGECICLWGVSPGLFEEGVVWLIATTEAEEHGRKIHRFWPREVGMMHMRYSTLAAIAYANNRLHLSWLEAIGFVAIAVDEVGPGRLPFITYVRREPCVLH